MRLIAMAIVVLFMDMAFGQSPTLTLRAKLRDFKDYLPTDPTTHADFENDAYMGCGGTDLGYVRNTIAVDGPVDTTVFRGDNRGPVLQKLSNTSIPPKQCFTSLEKFGDWYNDKPAVNRSFYTDLVLTRNAQGIYTFNDDNFLPLNPGAGWRKFQPTDPDPFGPRPDITPNDVWGFTMELHTTFTYSAGQTQIFTFKGDDDVWVYINDKLVIDLGGLHSQLTSTVNLDAQAAALGLVDGASYPLDFFFAERHSTGSHCQITTSLQLIQSPQLPIPVATPAGQAFRTSIQVSVTVPAHSDAQIRYTTDGTEPTETSLSYSAPLTFAGNTTLKAKAFKPDFQPSPTLTEVYTLEQVKLPTPVATPSGKTFQLSLSVGLTVPGHPDAAIRYYHGRHGARSRQPAIFLRPDPHRRHGPQGPRLQGRLVALRCPDRKLHPRKTEAPRPGGRPARTDIRRFHCGYAFRSQSPRCRHPFHLEWPGTGFRQPHIFFGPDVHGHRYRQGPRLQGRLAGQRGDGRNLPVTPSYQCRHHADGQHVNP